MRLLALAVAFVLGMALATAVKAREETYDQCYARVTAEGGSEQMVRWICGIRSGWWDYDKEEPYDD